MILCIETTSGICSAALCDKSGVIAIRESDSGRSHAALLTVFIEELLNKSGIKPSALEAVAVSKGPGSYTGLRIGVSVAKGICYASSVPLIGIETTLSMFHGFMSETQGRPDFNDNDLFCPAIDARRMEIYYSVFDITGRMVRAVSAEVMTADSLSGLPSSSRLIMFGDGAMKCRDVLRRTNVVYYDGFRISASSMQKPAYEAFANKSFEDVAYFEPYYLKDFITSKPVKNILRK